MAKLTAAQKAFAKYYAQGGSKGSMGGVGAYGRTQQGGGAVVRLNFDGRTIGDAPF